MHHTISRGLATALLLILAACATPTPYQPAGRYGGGYADQRLETNRYRITFYGNSQTPRQQVETYLLYRAAEVTLQNGYDYFVMVDQDIDAETSYTQSFSGGYYYWHPYPYWGANVGTSVPRTEYQAHANILVFKGTKPADNPRAFDARDVKANLEPLIQRPEPEQ